MKKDILACGLAAAFAVGAMVATAGAEDVPQARVAFDRAGGFTVERGAEASVTARVEDGGGYWFGAGAWESDNGGHATGELGETFIIDTSVPGEYRARVRGGCDGTDREVVGAIRFRVVEAAGAARGARGLQEGETQLWREEFGNLSTGGEITSYSGTSGQWTAGKAFAAVVNESTNLRIGSANAGGYVVSPSTALGGRTGRLEFSMWYYNNDSGTVVTLQRNTDGGTNWIDLATFSGLANTATNYSVDVPASQSVQFKWSNGGGGKRFYLDDVAVYQKPLPTNQPPTLDFEGETTVTIGDRCMVMVTATDFDGDAIEWGTPSPMPDGAVWTPEDGTGEAVALFEWTPAATGTWTIAFSATDKDGTATQELTLTVEPEGAGELAFVSGKRSVREGADSAVLTVARTGGAAGAVGVRWATADGTAASGVHYTGGSGTLSFADGETLQTLSVPILDNTNSAGNAKFTVALSNPTGGAALGADAVCTVTIVDDDDTYSSYYTNCYKNGSLKTGDSLKSALSATINKDTYTNWYSRLMDILPVTDACPTNANQVQCIYLQRGISASDFNREHLWPQSHDFTTNYPAYSDLHHVRASDETINALRGNLDFDDCRGKTGCKTNNGCYYIGNTAWEPPDSAKGDVARAVMYMDVRYEANGLTPIGDLELVDYTGTSGSRLGKLSTLLAWNELDPPDDFERRRNDLIYSTYQNNRNPFVDHPEWARAVFDPDNFVEETVSWEIAVEIEGEGWVNGNSRDFAVTVDDGKSKVFEIVPESEENYRIVRILQDGREAGGYVYTNETYRYRYTHTWNPVTNNGTLKVVFAQEPLGGTSATASGVSENGFTLSWDAVDDADGYRVRVLEAERSEIASAEFENATLDAGWTLSDSGAELSSATGAAMSGTWGLAFSTNGAWLMSPAVANPASVGFTYRRSSGNSDAWSLAVQVSEDGGATWANAGTVTNAGTSVKTNTTDLTAWYGKTVQVRLLDTRPSGGAGRYVDAVTVRGAGGTVLEEWVTGGDTTSWTATGLTPSTAYDATVRAEGNGYAPGTWSSFVHVTTANDSGKREQSITFPAIADQTVGATVALGATASSGLEVSYAVSGPATRSGTTLTCTATGTVTVVASQDGNAEWKPAAGVTRTFTVTEPELAAPENVRASATNATDFTAAWSAVDGATGYELSVWTQTAGGSVVVTNETVLFSSTFEDISGNGNARLNADAIAGWSFANAFAATNEIKVGVSGAGGSVTSATYTASGTLRVVTEAHAWGSDGTVLWVGATGQDAQSNQLDAASGRFTNTFEGVDGEVAVSWTTTAGKKRFLLEAVEISVLTEAKGEGGGGTVPVDGYDARAVEGTSCAVTGLVAETTYFFRVRAMAAEVAGPWSAAADVTTLAGGGDDSGYAEWLDRYGLTPDTAASDEDYDSDNVSNWQEYIADTDPTDDASFLRLVVELQQDGSWIAKPDPASTNRSYSIVTRTDLTDDATLATNSLGRGTEGLAATNSMPADGNIWFGSIRVQLEVEE